MPLAFAQPTMRLARPIMDGDGKLVAGTGTLLAERIVRLLRRMALQTVVVEDAGDLQAWETVRPLQQQLLELEERFEREKPQKSLDTLKQAIARYLVRREQLLAEDPALTAQPEVDERTGAQAPATGARDEEAAR